ncbi:hypothetical protein Ct61P_03735 [Colletotrichum tofieldiae]|nr:hypothetical protein Ct61P_03735 [Colletotrichum tofieldiae]
MSADYTVPISGLDELKKHLDDLVSAPETPLDPKLLDDVELQLNARRRILPHNGTSLSGPVREPPCPRHSRQGLLLPLRCRHPLPHARVIEELLRRWLSAPQVEVGEKATRVLGDLLDIDCELPPPSALPNLGHEVVKRRAPGQGRMWRRVFHDRELFSLILSLARGQDPAEGITLSEHQLSLAQGRILRILPRLASLNIVEVGTSPFPDLTGSAETGLLQLAALHMVDKKDTLMHLSLVDFFETLLSVMRVVEHSHRTMGILKDVVRQAIKDDNVLKMALMSLHDRTVPEESDALRTFIRDVMA